MLRAKVKAIWRYPVKSLGGEELLHAQIREKRGILGDRAYALVDVNTGKVASAKKPKPWGKLLELRASYTDEPVTYGLEPPITVHFPDGQELRSDEDGLDAAISEFVGREVEMVRAYGEAHRTTVAGLTMPVGTFFDAREIHIITTNAIKRMRAMSPDSVFEPERFRPNLLIKVWGSRSEFPEDEWVSQRLEIGWRTVVHVEKVTGRCVMTNLAQPGLEPDSNILRTAHSFREGNFGVYAKVVNVGPIRVGDMVVERHEKYFPT